MKSIKRVPESPPVGNGAVPLDHRSLTTLHCKLQPAVHTQLTTPTLAQLTLVECKVLLSGVEVEV